MPAWLEILLNLSGYAGFVALATRGPAASDESVDHDQAVSNGGAAPSRR